jgi:hypothetical protein
VLGESGPSIKHTWPDVRVKSVVRSKADVTRLCDVSDVPAGCFGLGVLRALATPIAIGWRSGESFPIIHVGDRALAAQQIPADAFLNTPTEGSLAI